VERRCCWEVVRVVFVVMRGFQARRMVSGVESRGSGTRKPYWFSWLGRREERNEVLHCDRDAGAGTMTIDRGPGARFKGCVPAGRMQVKYWESTDGH